MVALDEDTIKVREIKLFKYGQGPETAEESYDISGIHRTGEVVRLFAKGFKNQRDLLQTEISVKHPGLDACTSYDAETGNYHIWLVQRSSFDYRFKFDLSALGLPAGLPVIAEAVGPGQYGEVVEISEIQNNSSFEITLPGQTVMLITIPSANRMKKMSISPESAFTVSGDNHPAKINSENLKVSLDASKKENNNVSYIHFDNSELAQKGTNELTLLGINGFVDKGEKPMQIHVYGFPSKNLKGKKITWENAPHLDSEEALVHHIGEEVFFAGQISFNKTQKYRYLDVTRHIKKYPDGITFILIRETRHMGDYGDKGRNVVISPAHSDKSPVLINYSNAN